MFNRVLVSSVLTLGGTVTLASTAMAGSVDIQFSGTVQGVCSFSNPTSGFLVTDNPGPGLQYVLSSDAPGGAPGQVTVTCNQPADMLVSAPVQTAGPSGAAYIDAFVESPYTSTGAGGSMFLEPGVTPVTINMMVDNPNGLQPGNYAYTVTLTVVD
jgi:hypothetical protein